MVGVLVLGADQATKLWARSSLTPGQDLTAIPGWLWFRLVTNTGMTLGLLSGNNQLLSVVSLLVVAALALLALRAGIGGSLGMVALGAIAGGALGNVLDRLRLGSVTDFIEVRIWPTDFNLADAAIRIGVVLFLLTLLVEVVRGVRRTG